VHRTSSSAAILSELWRPSPYLGRPFLPFIFVLGWNSGIPVHRYLQSLKYDTGKTRITSEGEHQRPSGCGVLGSLQDGKWGIWGEETTPEGTGVLGWRKGEWRWNDA
jgi:hypothetical protein